MSKNKKFYERPILNIYHLQKDVICISGENADNFAQDQDWDTKGGFIE